MIGICKICGKEFNKRRKTSKYCSVDCQHKGLIKHDYSPRICPICGKEFVPCRDCKGIYCSKECARYSPNVIKQQQINLSKGRRIAQEKKQVNDMIKELKQEVKRLYKRKEQLDNIEQHIGHCGYCGNIYYMKCGSKFCSDECRRKYNNRIKWEKKERRIYKNGKPDLSITLTKLYMRDNGICSLCGKHIDFDCDSNSNDYPSIDHIVPIAKGGTHTWDNVQLACRGCNTLKSDKIIS